MKLTFRFCCLLGLGLTLTAPGSAVEPVDGHGLRNAAVLIIRHAEKPESGPTLSPVGEARAKASVAYFKNLVVD